MKLEALASPKGEGVVLKTAEDLKAFLAPIVDRLNVLSERAEAAGTAISEDDIKPMKDALQALAADIGAVKPQVETLSRGLSTHGDDGFAALRMAMIPPEGLSKAHFNLLTLSPAELSFAASVASAGGGRKLLEKCGMSDSMQAKLAEFKAMSDALYITDVLMAANSTEYAEIGESRTKRLKTLKGWKAYDRLVQEFKAAAGTALDTQTSEQGLEWIPTMFSSQLHELVQVKLVVASLFDNIPMPGPTYVSPVAGADMIAYKMAEALEETGTAKVTSRTFITKKMTLSAKKLGARILTSTEFVEDSLVPVIPRIIAQIAKALARGIDDAWINGDVTATHMHADVTGSDDRRKLWKGLLKTALAGPAQCVKDVGAADISIRDHLMAVRKGMKQYGLPGAGAVHITGFSSLVELLLAKDDNGNNVLLTIDKYGPGAVIRTGEVGSVAGVPVILSEFIREDLDATGVNTAPTDNRTIILTPNTESFVGGTRRAATITRLNEVYAETDQIAFVGTWRGDMNSWFDSTVEPLVGLLHNINS